MPRSKGRPIARFSRAAFDKWAKRILGRAGKSRLAYELVIIPNMGARIWPSRRVLDEQLKDRRDYRQTLIYRLERARGQRRLDLDNKLVVVEREIGRLKG